MSNAPLALAISVVLVTALPVHAQDVTGFARCRAIADAGERLGCYDGLAEAFRGGPQDAAVWLLLMWVNDIRAGVRARQPVDGQAQPPGLLAARLARPAVQRAAALG